MQTKFTKLLSLLLVSCLLLATAMPTLAAPGGNTDSYTVSITPATYTCEQNGSITFTATVTKNGAEIDLTEQSDVYLWIWADSWADGHSEGLTNCVVTTNDGLQNSVSIYFPSAGTYYIAYTLTDAAEDGNELLKSTSVATITVTEASSETHNYALSVALDSGKLGTDSTYPYVYSSTDTTVSVTVTVTEDEEVVTELDSKYSIYVWFEDEDSDDNAITTATGTLGTGGAITGTITLSNYSFTEGTNYNVYARVNYNDEEVDDSMVGTSFTINTTYALVLQMDTANYDSTTGIYVYDLGDTANVTVSLASVINGVEGNSSTSIPTGTMLTIWYQDDNGWSDLTFDLGSRVHLSDAYGGNPTTLELSSSSFTAGKIYTMSAGLYNEGGQTLATMSVQFTIPAAAFYTRTLTLDGDVGVNYYVDMTGVDADDMENYRVVFSGTGIDQTATFNAGSYRDDWNGTKYYRFTVTVDSTQMATEFTAELQYGGTTIQTDTYSVESYCKWAITNNKAEQAICAALLNYGGYSQTYFESTGTKANANLSTYFSTAGDTWSDPVASEFTADLSSYITTTSGTIPSEITDGSFSASLVLGSQTVIRIYFNASSTDNLTFAVGEETLDIQNVASGSNYNYYVEYEVQASKLGTAIEFTISDGTDTGTVSYSAYAYINTQLNSTAATDALKNVCKAMYYYGQEAIEYNNWYKGTT